MLHVRACNSMSVTLCTFNKKNFIFFFTGRKPTNKTKVFSVIYKSLHELLPTSPTEIKK